MRHPLAVAVAAAAATAWLGAPAAAEDPEGLRETVDVTLVEVPVRVLDRAGEPVRGLTTGDFTLFDEGRRQQILAVDAIELAEHAAPAPGAAMSPAARRRFLFLFDFSFARPKAIVAARRAAKDFVLSGMRDSDLAAVGTYSVETGVRLLVTFSSDRAELADAIETLGLEATRERADPLRFAYQTRRAPSGAVASSGRVRPEEGRSRGQPDIVDVLKTLASGNRARNDDYERSRARSLIQSLRELGRTLDAVEGRKDIVFLSEGFPSRLLVGTRETTEEQQWLIQGEAWKVDADKRFGNSTLRSELSEMGAFVQRTDSVIHTVDIAGIAADADGDGIHDLDSPAPGGATANALFELARETGGEAFRGNNDIGAELRRLTHRTSFVYVLSYRPDRTEGEGKYHALKVKVGRSGARVVARSGYFERRDFRKRTPLERSLSAADVIANEIPFADVVPQVLAAPFAKPGPERGALVSMLVEIPGAGLLEGDTAGRTTLEIYAYAFDAGEHLGGFVAESFGIDLARSRDRLVAGGLRYFGELQLPPGNYRLRTLVRNANTGRMGLTVTSLRVPAFEAGEPFLLEPVFLEAASENWVAIRGKPREGEASAAPPALASFAGLGGENVVPAAVPRLAPGSTARVCLVSYNFGTPGGSQDTFKIGSQLLAPDGRPLSAATLALLGKSPTEADGRRVFLLSFTAPAEMVPGRYGLRILMEDGATSKPRHASTAFVVP